jgi:hypothetical protein
MSKNNTSEGNSNKDYIKSFRNLVEKSRNNEKIITNEFEKNHVLTVQLTKTNLFILLKNGIVLSCDLDSKKKEKHLYKEKGLPQEIKVHTKLIDLVCGKAHCLARGFDNKIYAWGSNSYGQLGLGREVKDIQETPKDIQAEHFDVS